MDNNGATGGALRHTVNERLKGALTVTESASALRAAAAPPADAPFYLQASARRRFGATEGTDKKQWDPKWTLAGCRLATFFIVNPSTSSVSGQICTVSPAGSFQLASICFVSP